MNRELRFVPCDNPESCNGCPGFRETIQGSGPASGFACPTTVEILDNYACPGDSYTEFVGGSCPILFSFGTAVSLNFFPHGAFETESGAYTVSCSQLTLQWTGTTIGDGGGGSGSDYIEQIVYVNISISHNNIRCCS